MDVALQPPTIPDLSNSFTKHSSPPPPPRPATHLLITEVLFPFFPFGVLRVFKRRRAMLVSAKNSVACVVGLLRLVTDSFEESINRLYTSGYHGTLRRQGTAGVTWTACVL